MKSFYLIEFFLYIYLIEPVHASSLPGGASVAFVCITCALFLETGGWSPLLSDSSRVAGANEPWIFHLSDHSWSNKLMVGNLQFFIK